MQKLKSATEFTVGGLCYGLLEISWRGHTHISMFIAGGICFCLISLVARRMSHIGLIFQSLVCSIMITSVEFAVGAVVNLWLGLNVWDYSMMWGNLLGQVCPQFAALWCAISIMAIYLRNVMGKYLLHEQPYTIRLLPVMLIKRRAAE